MLATTPLQLSDAGAGVVFGQKLDRPGLSSLALHGDTSGFTKAKLPIRAAFCRGISLN